MTEREYKYAEGGDAYREWWDQSCAGPMPQAPYPADTVEYTEWNTGFDDAMEWQLNWQYLDL